MIDFPLDTNVLFYAMDRDAGKRHKLAMKIVDRASVFDCVLILQSLSYCPLSFETLHGFARSLILFVEENNTPVRVARAVDCGGHAATRPARSGFLAHSRCPLNQR